jgi:hypothetical protein
MTIQQKIILLSAKVQPTQEEIKALGDALVEVRDWEALQSLLIAQGVGPLFYKKLSLLANAGLVPAVCREKLKQSSFLTLSRGMLQYNVFRKMTEVLQGCGIPFLLLKGAYLAEKLYGDIALRQFSDIDVLIKEADGEQAQRVLREAGCRSEDYAMAAFLRKNVGFEHYPQMIFQGVPVELHVRLNRPNERFDINTDSVWQYAEKVNLQGFEVFVPDRQDTLIHTCVHLHKHFCEGHIQLTGMHDIVNMLNSDKFTVDWPVLISRCEQYGCTDVVLKYLMLASKYYGIGLPEFVSEKYGRCLLEADEALFIQYLSGYRGKHFSVKSRFEDVEQLKGWQLKLKYLWHMLFPTKKYMLVSYKIKNPSLYWLYYPYRYWVGLKGIWRMVREKF